MPALLEAYQVKVQEIIDGMTPEQRFVRSKKPNDYKTTIKNFSSWSRSKE